KSFSGGSTPRFEFRPEKITPVILTHCLEWGGFFEVDLEEIEAAIGGLRLGEKVSRQDSGKAPACWIHIPPLANASQAAQKMRELESLGVTDYTQVQDESQWNNAISMGYFHEIKKAQVVMASLRNKGV